MNYNNYNLFNKLNSADDYEKSYAKNKSKKSNFKTGAVATALAIFLMLIITALCIEVIPPGYAGVIYNRNKGIEDKVLSQGWHLIAPWKKVISYPISTETVYLAKDEKKDNSFNITTKDGKPVNVDVVYSYHMDPDKLPSIATKFRAKSPDLIQEGFIKDRLKESVQKVTSQYGVIDVYGEKRDELNTRVFQEFKNTLEPHGIIIETFSFSRIEPDAASMKAIQAKVDAQQELERLQIEKQQAEVMAEKKRIEAKAEAEAKIIQAEGQAKANAKLQQSITQNLIQYEMMQRWDGKLPQYVGNGQTLINLPTNTHANTTN